MRRTASAAAMASLAVACVAVLPHAPRVGATAGVARTPPMGFNTWNNFGCGVSAQVLTDTADAFVSTGLKDVGFTYINSDDCWMLKNRSNGGTGPQIPNPEKFPNGIPPVVDYIESKGLKMGLYTARAPHTCAGFAASCQHEAVDAKQWAAWGVSYMKDDSCGTCRDALSDYRVMQQAIDATGHALVLSIEGQPPIANASDGLHGNMRRVGHDISAAWLSMATLVDTGAGLWPYAHNETGYPGSFWNDLDMLEIGRGDFDPDTAAPDAAALALAQARSHFSLWCVMKAPLLLGNDLTTMGPLTLAVVSNKEVIAVNQDALGVQARRIASTTPANTTLLPPADAVALFTPCKPGAPEQQWRWLDSADLSTALQVAECNATDPRQMWSGLSSASATSYLKDKSEGRCVDTRVSASQGESTAPCAGPPVPMQQQWQLTSAGHMQNGDGRTCLDVYDFQGPVVQAYGCKKDGDNDGNQVWAFNATTGLIVNPDSGKCLAAVKPQPGTMGQVAATADDGTQYCIYGNADALVGGPCGSGVTSRWSITPAGQHSQGNYTLHYGARELAMMNQFGQSGPLPHTRWGTVAGGVGTGVAWAPSNATAGAPIVALMDSAQIIDDDCVGGVQPGEGDWCLELSRSGNLEVWAGPLSGGRGVAALFNRSPYKDSIAVTFADVPGLPPAAQYDVRDVWAGADVGSHAGSYSTQVAGHGVALLVLTPVS